jgi:glycosyltransferase involved in cell wall biosynthesis
MPCNNQEMSDVSVIHIALFPVGGGAELLVRELNKRNLENGIKSIAIYFQNPTNTSLYNNEYCLNTKSLTSLFNIYKIRTFIKKHIKKSDNDKIIIHTHLTYPFIFTAIATIGMKIKLVYTEHNSYNKRKNYKLFSYIDKLIYRRYDIIICISNGVRKSLLQWVGLSFDDKVRVIYNGSRLFKINEDRRKVIDSTKLKIVSIGTLTYKKGFDISIRALQPLLNNEVEQYVIIGEGEERKKIECLIDSLNIRDYVTLAGWSDNIEQYLNEADLFLIPSRWEGFGLVVVEALSTGLPVLASNVDGLNELFLSNDCPIFYFECENLTSLYNGVINIKSFLIENENIAWQANACSKHYSFEKMLTNYIDTYKTLL